MADQLWASKRLVYCGIEEEHDPFLLSMQDVALTLINSDPRVPTPRTKKNSKGTREWMQNQCLLGVLVCLPADSPEAPQRLAGADGGEAATKDDRKPIPVGTIALMGGTAADSRHNSNAEISIKLAPQFQGKGYGSEAILWCLNWAFQFANLHRVGISAFENNTGAERLYQRLGFKHEGRERESIYTLGRYWDLIHMGMLRREWEELYGPTGSGIRVATSSLA